jgi:hypothetical protein
VRGDELHVHANSEARIERVLAAVRGLDPLRLLAAGMNSIRSSSASRTPRSPAPPTPLAGPPESA